MKDQTSEDYEIINRWDNVKGCNDLLSRLVACHGNLFKTIQPVIVIEPIEPKPPSCPQWIKEIEEAPRGPTIKGIKSAVAKHFRVDVADLESECRKKELVLPRHIAMHLCKKLAKKSFPEIGRRFGGRDHSTALFAFHKIEDLCVADPIVSEAVKALEARLI